MWESDGCGVRMKSFMPEQDVQKEMTRYPKIVYRMKGERLRRLVSQPTPLTHGNNFTRFFEPVAINIK